MEHPFFTTAAATRAEALRWLSIAEKLLSARDLMGSKSFATRARDADPSLSAAEEILAVADTLLAGDRRIGSNQPDFYGVLRLTPPQGRDAELVANQYRGLVLLLNPQRNRFPFADQAFRLVIDAWSVLSNPSRKSLYDKEIGFYQHQPDPFSVPMPALQQQFIFTQPQMHGASEGSSSVAASLYVQPQQVHPQHQRVGPMIGGPTREPQNFMGYPSGTNLVFGSGSGSRSSHEPVNNQVQENYSSFAGYMHPASEPPQEQLNINNNINIREKQPELEFSNVGNNNNNIHHVKTVSHENVEQTIEVEENVDDRAMEEEEDEEEEEDVEEEIDDSPANDDESAFWTACPYCYYMYQYPKVYVDSTMRCQNCKRAFQAVVIPSPPPVVDGQEAYFCCWGFLPLGFSAEIWKKHNGAAWQTGNNSGRRFSAPRVYMDDDDVIFADISSSSESDVDWQDSRAGKRKFRANSVKGNKEATRMTPNRRLKKVPVANKGKNMDVQEAVVPPCGLEMPNTKLATGPNGRKQPNRAVKTFGKLDLNVELSNEADEPAPSANKVNGPGRREDDNNIEGIGFFEGLDELFSNLPILNVVADDKVVKAA